jgi:hypothetical protein
LKLESGKGETRKREEKEKSVKQKVLLQTAGVPQASLARLRLG